MNPLGSRRIWREAVGKNPSISVGNTASTKSPDYSGTGQFLSVFFDLGGGRPHRRTQSAVLMGAAYGIHADEVGNARGRADHHLKKTFFTSTRLLRTKLNGIVVAE